MLIYNPKDWFTFILKVHKSDTLRKLGPMILVIALYSIAIAYWEQEYLDITDHPWIKNIPIMHSLLGFAISILLVFRTNTAYDRWWEGRKLWGQLVNVSRNLAIKIASDSNLDEETKEFYRKMIPLYAATLRTYLISKGLQFVLDEKEHPEFANFANSDHEPNHVALLMHDKLFKMRKNNKIDDWHFQSLLKDLGQFTDVCGGCERIKNTPIPYSYSAFIKKFIFIYIMTLPFGYVFLLGYYVAPIVAMVFYVLASMEVIAEEIEDPFGDDSNDLPITKISQNIEKHINQIFQTKNNEWTI